ncbi:MAG: hypothetical protein PHW60_01915 [Kiritimatiellae bacterium]|nr:hypothetical protein [Kiritimatiellia bacterium]
MKHQKRWSGLTRIVCIVAALAIGLTAARAATTWNTAGSGDKLNWSDANNWNPVGVPGDGAEVVITNGSVLLTNATYNLASLTITGATARLTFSNWDTKLTATNVIIQSGATVTHVTNSATATNELGEWPADGRVWIVCTNFDLQVGGKIDTKGQGYIGGESYANGYGPGGGIGSNAANYGGGGGHGAIGGRGSQGAGGAAYDSTNAPITPGSGGGSLAGGAGGGAVLIEADNGAVIINGIIDADGLIGRQHGGGGSGGSIYIKCRTFAGTTNGLLTAQGGNARYLESGQGSGGRIAVIYDPAAQGGEDPQPSVRFNIAHGKGLGGYRGPGYSGTLYLPDETILQPDLSNFEDVRFYGITNWSVDHLSLTNPVVTNNIIFSEPRFILTVSNTMLIDTATLQLGDPRSGIEYVQIACGRLQLNTGQNTNPSLLYVYSGPTNDVVTNYGARVTVMEDVVIASNSWICPVSDGTNGGSVFFSVNNVTINAGGGFDANGLGYDGGCYYTKPLFLPRGDGCGPGKGVASASNYGTGAGYGGKGGKTPWTSTLSPTYPWTNAPRCPGSGGGGTESPNGDGGGLVWIKATGTVILDGTIQANGNGGRFVGGSAHSGGGSGGGIFIVANKFRGAASGLLSAYGGAGAIVNAANYCGGGGGGRIAVWHRISEADQQTILADPDNAAANVQRIVITNDVAMSGFLGSCTASNGYSIANDAGTGTVVYLTVPPPKGTIFSVR